MFHLAPWDQGRMTLGDLVAAVDTIEARNAEAKKMQREASRGRS